MLKTFDLRGREKPLTVYGPPGPARRSSARSGRSSGRITYPLHLHELDRDEEVAFDGYASSPFPVDHRVAGATATRSSRTTGRGASTRGRPTRSA